MIVKKWCVGALIVGALGLRAQSTSVTATIADSDGQTWNNGTVTATFVPGPTNAYKWTGGTIPNQIAGAMDDMGTFTISPPDNTTITPIGSAWRFTICPNASSGCQSKQITVAGSSMDLSAQLSAIAIGPRFPAKAWTYGYLDVEIQPVPLPGGMYWNVTSLEQHCWTGTAWETCSGGGGGGTDVNLNSSPPQSTLAINGFMPQVCIDSSGNGLDQICNTATGFVPQAGNCVIYSASNTNGGSLLSVNINSFGSKPIALPTQVGWSTTLPEVRFPVGKPVMLCYDGTNWNASALGTTPGGFIAGFQVVQTGSLTVEVDPGTVNCNGTFVQSLQTGLTLTGDSNNYIFLDTSSGCALTTNTTGFGSSNIPIAEVSTNLGIIPPIVDMRTLFTYKPGGGTTTNALTMNDSGTGASPGSTFDGSAAKTISYNTIGAAASGAATTVNGRSCALGNSCTVNPPLDKSTNGLANPTADATFTYPSTSTTGFTFAGTAPASVSTATGTNATLLFNVSGVTGGATSNSSGTGGIGSSPSLAAGAGGAGTGTTGNGGAGGAVAISGGNGANGAGSNANGGNGGTITLTPGSGGSKTGSGTAGTEGLVYIPGALASNAEFSNGTCTTAATIAASNGNRQSITLTNGDTCALTFTQPASGTASITLKVIQSSSSTYNGLISGCKWPGGTVPTITATTGAIDFVSIYLNGSNAYCAALQNFM